VPLNVIFDALFNLLFDELSIRLSNKLFMTFLIEKPPLSKFISLLLKEYMGGGALKNEK
jgi:hypothetical protein